MTSEDTKRAAEEFIAAKLSEQTLAREDALNREAALRLAPKVWKQVTEAFVSQCKAWNSIINEEALSCKETILGDLRIRCAGRSQVSTVHYDSHKLRVTLKNSARP